MSIKEIFRIFRADYHRLLEWYHTLFNLDLSKRIKNAINIFFTYNVMAVFIFRMSQYFFSKNFKIIARIFHFINVILFSIDINPGSSIGEGLIIIHAIGTCISCKIGKNCTIYGRAGLGGDPFNGLDVGAGPGTAVIGDNVIFGFGATVLGPVTIGNNAIIGGCSLVIDSVPDNAIVAGVPAKILKYRDDIK